MFKQCEHLAANLLVDTLWFYLYCQICVVNVSSNFLDLSALLSLSQPMLESRLLRWIERRSSR